MVSRETLFHAAVAGLVLLVALATTWVFPDTDSTLRALVLMVLYGLVYAGGHLFLALRGRDGSVPVSARWRFVALVGFLVVLGAVAYLTDPVDVGPVTTDDLLGAAGVGAAVAYLAVEGVSGYRASVVDQRS
jgi:uncharacterized membrane protein (UPF0182 family)